MCFESVLCTKTVKSRLFKKHLERRKLQARFCLSLGWLHISEKKKQTENINSVGAGAQKVVKTIFGEHKKGKLYALKKVGLSKFKVIL